MKIKKEMYLHWSENYKGESTWDLFAFDMSSSGCVLVRKQEIEFEVPDNFNPVPVQVQMLNKEKERITEEFNNRVAAIQEQISKLQCLEYAA